MAIDHANATHLSLSAEYGSGSPVSAETASAREVVSLEAHPLSISSIIHNVYLYIYIGFCVVFVSRLPAAHSLLTVDWQSAWPDASGLSLK